MDKVLHFMASFLVARVDPVLAGVVGLGKEWWDHLTGGVADGYDLLADGLGIIASLLLG